MVKRVSKNTRAARRAIDELPQSKELENVPRAQKTDLVNILLRTANKNETLLQNKMKRKRDKKMNSKSNRKSLESRLTQTASQIEKEKLERALQISNRLDGKRTKSLMRAKFVQTSRKSGWDEINTAIRREAEESKLKVEAKHNPESQKASDDMDIERTEKTLQEEEEEEQQAKANLVNKHLLQTNIYEMLGEEEEG